MSGLPREVIKWLQTLDLSYSIKNVRRDFSNGYLVAEIFSWYYPQQIEMHFFSKGSSLQMKLDNWQQLEKFFIKEGLEIPKEFIEGTIHCKPGAACTLLERAYTLLTHRELHYLPSKCRPQDFNDAAYQSLLPPLARSTATMAVKNNIANTELSTQPDRIICQQKAQVVLDTHQEQRRQERVEFPERFRLLSFGERVSRDNAFKEKTTASKGSTHEIMVKQRKPEKT